MFVYVSVFLTLNLSNEFFTKLIRKKGILFSGIKILTTYLKMNLFLLAFRYYYNQGRKKVRKKMIFIFREKVKVDFYLDNEIKKKIKKILNNKKI